MTRIDHQSDQREGGETIEGTSRTIYCKGSSGSGSESASLFSNEWYSGGDSKESGLNFSGALGVIQEWKRAVEIGRQGLGGKEG